MTLKHLFLATTVALGLQAAPAMAQDAAIDAMQEYMMFSEYEAGIILPQQIDQTVFETALFVDTRDAGQFEAGTIPGAVLGWDMTAALALGHALGIPALAIAELLPAIEAEMIRRTNEQIGKDRDRG